MSSSRRWIYSLVPFAAFTFAGCLTDPAPTIKTFVVSPANTCATNPSPLVVTWETSGDSVDIKVVDARGTERASFAHLPAQGSRTVDSRASLRGESGVFTVKLVATLSGVTTAAEHTATLVGAEGTWFGMNVVDMCDTDACNAWGPAQTTLTQADFDNSLVTKQVRLDAFQPSFNRTQLEMDQVSHPNTAQTMCGSTGECGATPVVRPVPAGWTSPYGTYTFSGQLTPSQGKSENVSVTHSVQLVCR